MNRYRMNAILEILLFPVCNPDMGKNDYLFSRYKAYKEFLDVSLMKITNREERNQKSREFQKANKELLHYLADRIGGKVKSYDDIIQLCELYYPLLGMNHMMDKLLGHKNLEETEGAERDAIHFFYIHNLTRIANSLITYRDGIAAIRTWSNTKLEEEDIFQTQYVFDKVEIWNILCRLFVPDLLIVLFAVENGMELEMLYGQKPYISLADKLLVKYLRKGLAENHMHFNVGFDYESLWLYVVNIYRWETITGKENERFKDKDFCLNAAVFRLTAAVFLKEQKGSKRNFASWVKAHQSWCRMLPVFIQKLHNGEMNSMTKGQVQELVISCLHSLSSCRVLEGKEYDYLLYAVYQENLELKVSSEWMLLYECCRYIKSQREDGFFAAVFFQYIRIKNAYFQQCQQKYFLQGLKYFQEIFASSKNAMKGVAGAKGILLESFRSQAKITSLRKLEIRIAPNVEKEDMDSFTYEKCYPVIRENLLNQLYHIFYAYRSYILESLLGVSFSRSILTRERKEQEENRNFSFRRITEQLLSEKYMKNLLEEVSVPSLGIVYHFIKSTFLDNISGYFCWRSIGEDMAKYSDYKLVWRQHMVNIAMVIESIRSTIPMISEYIVGIDAASDENAMEPWHFSPVYNKIRSQAVTRPILETGKSGKRVFRNIQNLSFTYHVGEDFRHIISGLRHIDEVMEQFHYKPGDRLGHAIALGIDIEKWVSDNENVQMPLQEYLENLLWIWGKNVYEGLNLPIQLERLEEDILRLAGQIYPNPEGITVRMLYEAYEKKFLMHHKKILEKLNKENPVQTALEKNGKRYFCLYANTFCEYEGAGWTAQKLLSTNYCPVFEEKYNKILLIPIRKEEAEYYSILQDQLLRKVEKLGIYVEVNPTSNVTIGDMGCIQEHPIFRMNTIGDRARHHVMVMVNSDDPAVFNTNVENELAYIYYALEHSGYPKEDVLEWIDKVRQNGLNGSFIQKEKKPLSILYEIGEIMDSICEEITVL